MRADQERKIGHRQLWGVLIALTLSSGLAACSREATSAAAPTDERVATAPDPGVQAQPVTPPSNATAQRSDEAPKPSPDAALADRVKSTLTGAGLGVLAVDIASTGGAITLYGTVDSAAVRDQAARVAASVAGVKSVANELVVVRGS